MTSNFVGRVVSPGLDGSQVGGGFQDVHGRPCGPRPGAVAAPLIMTTDLIGSTMRLLRERQEIVTGSNDAFP